MNTSCKCRSRLTSPWLQLLAMLAVKLSSFWVIPQSSNNCLTPQVSVKMIMQNGCGFWLQVYITFTFDQAAVIFRGQPSTTAMAPAWTVGGWTWRERVSGDYFRHGLANFSHGWIWNDLNAWIIYIIDDISIHQWYPSMMGIMDHLGMWKWDIEWRRDLQLQISREFSNGWRSNWGVIENGQAYPPKMVIVHGKYHD